MDEKLQIEPESLQLLEGSFLKIPFEQLRKVNRSGFKFVERELNNLPNLLQDLGSLHGSTTVAKGKVEFYIDRLRRLKRKLKEIYSEEGENITRLVSRLDHLCSISSSKTINCEKYINFVKSNLKRSLVDHMMRSGHIDIASKIADFYGIQEHTDVSFFTFVRNIEKQLLGHMPQDCIAWCVDNRNSLRENNSPLEFQLRLQEFIELARLNKFSECVSYARKNLSIYTDQTEYVEIMNPILSLSVFLCNVIQQPYCEFYSEDRWKMLANLFVKEITSLFAMGASSNFETTLVAGISALKTSACCKDTSIIMMCPICSTPELRNLAAKVPLSHHLNSSFICPITKKEIEDPDYPLVTSDGYVYSFSGAKCVVENSLAENSEDRSHDVFICPITGKSHLMRSLRRLYLM